MNSDNKITRLKNQIFVGNGFLLVPDFFIMKQLGYLEDIFGNKRVTDKCKGMA